MDPHATFIAWQDALRAGDLSAARQLRDDFNAWVNGGGFCPTVNVAAHTDLWMRGVRVALVSHLGDRLAHITHTLSGSDHRVHPTILTSTEA